MINFILISPNEMLKNKFKLVCKNLENVNFLNSFFDDKSAYVWMQNFDVDFVFLDLFLFDADAISFSEKIVREFSGINVILVSDFLSKEIIECAKQIGIKNIITTNISENILCEIFSIQHDKFINNNLNANNVQIGCNTFKLMEEKIALICLKAGISPRNLGYSYFKEAIKITVYNPDVMGKITKELYPMVAKKFDTTASRVERALRHAIDVASLSDGFKKLDEILGCSLVASNRRLTSSEFIALVADKISLEIL